MRVNLCPEEATNEELLILLHAVQAVTVEDSARGTAVNAALVECADALLSGLTLKQIDEILALYRQPARTGPQ
jgi:hypothetical protein